MTASGRGLRPRSLTAGLDQRSRLILGALAPLALVLPVLIALVSPEVATVWWLATACVAVIPLMVRTAQVGPSRIDVFEPIVFATFIYAIIFILPYGLSLFIGISYPYILNVDLDNGARTLILAMAGFLGGYLIVAPFPVPWNPAERQLKPPPWASRGVVWLAVSGACLFSLASLYFFWFSRAGGATAYVHLIGGLGRNVFDFRGTGMARAATLIACPAFFLAWLHLFSRERPTMWDWLLMLASGLTSIVATALSGNRVLLLWNFGVPVVIWHYYRKPVGVVRAIVGLAIAFTVAVVFTLVLRSPDALTSRTGQGRFDGLLDFAVGQTGEFHVVADITERQPYTTDYLGASTVIAAAVNVVPRAVWPDKPATAGETYTREFFPDIWANGSTFLGVPLAGELFLAGGSVTVLLGSAVVGAIVAWGYRCLLSIPHALAVPFMGVFMFSFFLLITRGFLQSYSFMLVWGAPLIAMMMVAISSRKHSDARPLARSEARPPRRRS